jgi:hypothetical protein
VAFWEDGGGVAADRKPDDAAALAPPDGGRERSGRGAGRQRARRLWLLTGLR